MRTRVLVFLILAVLTPLSVFSSIPIPLPPIPIPGIGIGGGKYEPYDGDFKKKTFINKPTFDGKAFGGKQYLKQVYNFVAGFSVDTKSEYPKTANMFDNTPALLGFHFKAGWHGDKQKEEYSNMREEIRKTLTEGFLKREIDSDLVELNNKAVENQTKALATLLMASVSYGHIVEPNKYQPQNYKDHKKPYYGFRLGQQAIRDGVLKAYMAYVINLKSEIAWFYDRINKYCPSSITSDQKVKLGGVDPDIDFNKIPPPVPVPTTGNFPISFMEVYRLMVNQLAGLGNVECLKLMAQLTQMKIELANMELMLALLASNYSMLNNQEKEWLR